VEGPARKPACLTVADERPLAKRTNELAHVHEQTRAVTLAAPSCARSIRAARSNPTAASSKLRNEPNRHRNALGAPRSTDEPKDGQPKPFARKRTAARGTNEPTSPSQVHPELHERNRDRHEGTDARKSHEGFVPTAAAAPVSPSPARRRRRPRSSPPPGCRRRHGAGPWCGHRSTGSPACRRRRRSGPW
jgi:hypothetical protein